MLRQIVVLAFLSLPGLVTAVTLAQQASSTQKSDRHMFPTVTRDISQRMDRLRAPTSNLSVSDLSMVLEGILQELGDQDFFTLENQSRLARGYRSELSKFIASLNPAIIEQYEQRYGAEAKRMLEQSLETRDERQLQSCSQRWFLTAAGQQACLTLARLEFDRNRPEVAIRRLLRMPAADRVEPERSILLARAYSHAGRAAEESQVWNQLKQRFPDATLRLGDMEVRVFQDGRVSPEVAAVAKPRAPHPSSAPEEKSIVDLNSAPIDWPYFRGDNARTAKVLPLDPAIKPHWERSLIPTTAEARNELQRLRASFAEADLVVAPVGFPVAVGDQLVARGLDAVHGINPIDGEIIWSYPSDLAPRRVRSSTSERIWKDASFGRISSDGKRIFFIDQREAVSEETERDALRAQFAALRGNVEPDPMPYRNQLVALDLKRQGAFAWIAGGMSGEAEPKLANATFLGPPLAVDDELYVVADITGRVLLAALSSLSGRMLWSQTIAQVDSDAVINNSTRRYGGAPLAVADGILVCPTTLGGVVAVDIASRQLLWGLQYRDLETRAQNSNRWDECDIMIAGSNTVVVMDGHQLIGLEIATGKQLWSRRRRDIIYVAVVGDDRLLLIGEHRVAGIRISDGKYLWSKSAYIAVPGGGSPAGRGLFDGKYYYLPTTDLEIVQLDVADGSITARQKIDQQAGNLIWHRNRVYSQTDAKLVAWLPAPMPTETASPTAKSSVDVVSLAPLELIEFLASNDFALREHAAQELLRRQSAALPALANGIHSTDTEVAYRSTSILTRLLDFPDTQTSSQARGILQTAVNAPTPFAANAYARESYWRANGAISELRRLGGLVRDNGKTVTLAVNWKGGNDGLAQLVWLGNLESLDLNHSGIDDSGLSYLGGMSQLKSLNLHRSAVTSSGLAHLVRASQLETLMLQGTQVDDSAVPYLAKIKQLKSVNLRNTNLSAVGAETLERQMPNVKIFR